VADSSIFKMLIKQTSESHANY